MTIKNKLITTAALISCLLGLAMAAKAQEAKPVGKAPASADKAIAPLTPERAIALAEQGRCREAIPILRKAVTASASKDQRKRAGLLGLRCAMTADDRLVAGELLGQLGRQFPNDPEVLY